jgi:hypothetical protein
MIWESTGEVRQPLPGERFITADPSAKLISRVVARQPPQDEKGFYATGPRVIVRQVEEDATEEARRTR